MHNLSSIGKVLDVELDVRAFYTQCYTLQVHIDALLIFAASHLSVQIWDRRPTLQWSHNERDDVSSFFTQPFVQVQIEKLRVTGFCEKIPRTNGQ